MRVAPWALLPLLGALVLYLLAWPEPQDPPYPVVIVHQAAIEATEPDTVVRWRERLKVVTPDPVQVAVAPGGAVDHVSTFCRPTVLRIQGDTAARPSPTLLLRSGALDRGRLFGTDRLTLTGPTSHGDLWQGRWDTRGDVSWVVTGDSVLVRHDRWALAKDAGAVGVIFGLGWLARSIF